MIVVSWANLGGLALSLFISGGFCPMVLRWGCLMQVDSVLTK